MGDVNDRPRSADSPGHFARGPCWETIAGSRSLRSTRLRAHLSRQGSVCGMETARRRLRRSSAGCRPPRRHPAFAGETHSTRPPFPVTPTRSSLAATESRCAASGRARLALRVVGNGSAQRLRCRPVAIRVRSGRGRRYAVGSRSPRRIYIVSGSSRIRRDDSGCIADRRRRFDFGSVRLESHRGTATGRSCREILRHPNPSIAGHRPPARGPDIVRPAHKGVNDDMAKREYIPESFRDGNEESDGRGWRGPNSVLTDA